MRLSVTVFLCLGNFVLIAWNNELPRILLFIGVYIAMNIVKSRRG